jgi:DNA polymerase zeta
MTAPTRGRLLPDPKMDAIVAVFYCLQDPSVELDQPVSEHGYYTGIWMVESEKNKMARLGNLRGLKVEYFESELDLFNEIVDRVRLWDPDVLAGWEVHGSSWGFLAGRASEEFSGFKCNALIFSSDLALKSFRSEPFR